MCGIVGTYGITDRSRSRQITEVMCDAIQHRGPDATGIWQNEITTLGHRRLSIIDVSEAGNQPFFSKDKKLTIVFNGEIYNYIELKKELSESYEFITGSDTEVILAAYEKWGIEAVNHFFGMFAFALWDDDLQKLFVVRDRLGIKPVYYTWKSNQFCFSSEIRALIKAGVTNKKVDRIGLEDYLRFQTVHAPRTILDDVSMLMPGQMIVLSGNEMSKVTYWNVNQKIDASAASHDAEEVKRNVFQLLSSSVEIRMRADVPFGAFLSGGIDSSAVVGLMSKVSRHKVKTFAVTFYEKEFDESPYSKLVADRFDTDHTEIKLRSTDFLELVPDALHAMDHPSGDGPNTFVVSKVTRECGVKMALSGLGGDELFAGYDVFRRMQTIENRKWLNNVPRPLRKLVGDVLKKTRPGISSEKMALGLAGERIDFAHMYPLTRQLFSDRIIKGILNTDRLSENAVEKMTREIALISCPLLTKVSLAEISSYMQNVLLRDTDQMSMAHALEVRVPFLDHRLVEYVSGVRDEIKFPHTPKQLVVDSLGDLLPREIVDRPKMGFTFPWALWMKAELREMCEENLTALNQIEYINQKEIQNLWNRFLQNDPLISWSRIWPLVTLGHWLKTHDIH
jgi:asparagine synthase (glutamine-hydrolysing)